jgi:hypothetical protein
MEEDEAKVEEKSWVEVDEGEKHMFPTSSDPEDAGRNDSSEACLTASQQRDLFGI